MPGVAVVLGDRAELAVEEAGHLAGDLGQQRGEVELAADGDGGVDQGVELTLARQARRAAWLLPSIERARSSMSSTAIRRWPPGVRVQGRKPLAVQRRTVTGETPSRRAARWTLR